MTELSPVAIRFVFSPAPNQLEPGGSCFFELRTSHWKVKEVPLLVGRVGFPGLQNGADVVPLNAFVYQFLSRDLGEHEVGVGEGVISGRTVNSGRRFIYLKRYARFPV